LFDVDLPGLAQRDDVTHQDIGYAPTELTLIGECRVGRNWHFTVAYYASGKVITPLLNNGHHLVTRAKTNAVAYLSPPKVTTPGKGRPRLYGEKIRLKDMAADDSAFTSAPSPVYGDSDVMVRFRVLDLLWKPVGRIVRFCIVHHPVRGTIFLLSTDTSLTAMEILQLYGYRFKIELGFRQAVHVIGTYAYHFWMLGMTPLHRGGGDQYLHRTTDAYRAAIRRKLHAYHVYVQLGCIAQGLLQHLAINHTAEVWRCFRSWLLTMNPAMPPSELIVASAPRTTLPVFIAIPALAPDLTKIMAKYRRHDPPSDEDRMAA